MKLITHNMLSCPIKGVKNGFPFRIEVGEVATREADFDPDFLRHILPRIEYGALRAAAASLGRCGPGGAAGAGGASEVMAGDQRGTMHTGIPPAHRDTTPNPGPPTPTRPRTLPRRLCRAPREHARGCH